MGSDDDRAMVRCRVCGKEVPRSAASSAEGRDYTYFFCGEGCRLHWQVEERVERRRKKRR
ncbi:MAG TPA: DUF3330 domain-containing protein [Burkholderiales bacterium]